MFKVNYKDTRTTPVSIVNFEHILYFVLVLLWTCFWRLGRWSDWACSTKPFQMSNHRKTKAYFDKWEISMWWLCWRGFSCGLPPVPCLQRLASSLLCRRTSQALLFASKHIVCVHRMLPGGEHEGSSRPTRRNFCSKIWIGQTQNCFRSLARKLESCY